ncbi:MAG TPA: chemotaxis protein CheB, partial [Candidatus Limnocylindrales bacterium]|nr:chemotaxis protein CheB [Candidatus Limnocylindrales bacterium]
MTRPKRVEGYQLVAIGASAGGIDALSTVIAALPADFPLPVVIAQHLDPKRQSSLAEILGRHARLPVRIVEDQTRLTPGTVYVVPAGRDVEINDHEVRLREARGAGPKPSVDRLLTSAAEALGDKLIAVILTGSGSDGAAGARDVKVAGGTVVVQDPKTASFPSMPRSLAPTSIDFVSSLEDVGPLLARLTDGSRVLDQRTEDLQLAPFLDRLREESGIDFNAYKRPTILRRLQRRMTASGQPTLAAYARYLERQPDEFRQLTASFLINVTEFFRDPSTFEYLRKEVLPALIADARAVGRELRLWSAGCSTGEETYSLAILVAELLGDDVEEFGVRIFATDVDADAISFARRGTYPKAALANVPEDLRSKYFSATDGEFEIVKPIRQLTIFGQHDLGVRAPFPRIDLILCRNVLIYFTGELQRRALQVFAFSLRTGGRLVLGSSESVSALPEYFKVEQPRLKIFRREGGPKIVAPLALPGLPAIAPQRRSSGLDVAVSATRQERDRSRTVAERSASHVQGLPFGVVVLDAHYDIEEINVAARRLLGIHGTAFGADFIHQAEILPASPLRAAIDAALRGEDQRIVLPVASPERATGAPQHLELLVRPIHADDERTVTGTLIGVRDATAEVAAASRADDLLRRLERAAETERRLLAANEEVTVANAALRVSNEEFLLSNEESQSAREEIETLNEELQATNEELETLNEELQASVEELNTANEDLQVRTQEVQSQSATLLEERSRLTSILASMGDGVLAVDRSGQRVMANAAFERMFPKIDDFQPEDDEGRPLPRSEQPSYRAARGEAFASSFTITEPDGRRRWFEATAQPLEGEDGHWGGVLVIRDISDRSLRRLQERFMAAA